MGKEAKKTKSVDPQKGQTLMRRSYVIKGYANQLNTTTSCYDMH